MSRDPITLSKETLSQFTISKPLYDRNVNTSTNRIAHIGVGQFHRSHQALYLHQLLNHDATAENLPWSITGIGLLSYDIDMKSKLQKQDFLYSVLTLGEGVKSADIVGSITDFLVAPVDGHEKLIETLADAQTKIVSLTITEHGYLQDASFNLDWQNAKVQQDLQFPEQFQTIYGLLYSSLKLRKERGLPSFTVLSCDNMPANGKLTQKLVLQFLSKLDPSLAQWAQQNTTFPSTMVDRITPRTTEEHSRILREEFGVEDQWPVAAEDFIQWIVEDNFVNNERPQFDKVGVIFTNDVTPFEELKLYLLNAGHSTLAYPSLLQGIDIVDEGMRNSSVREAVIAYMNEAKHAVPDNIPGVNKEDYIQTLIKRFSNPNIRDHTARLASQGYAKVQNFVVPALTHLLHDTTPRSTTAIARMLASWITFLGTAEKLGVTVDDARAADIVPLAKAVIDASDEDRLNDLHSFIRVGIPQLSEETSFVKDILSALTHFRK